MHRHALFLLFCALSTLPATASLGAENLATPRPKDFQFETVSDQSLRISEGDQPILVYNHGAIRSSTTTAAAPHSSYIHPIYGLDGETLTDDFPKDHVYHRGLYSAWSHILINGREYDTWSLRGIRIDFQRWLARETKPGAATLGVENAWIVGDKTVMQEKLWIEVHPASAESRSIDIALTWTPIDQPITLSGAPGKSYGGFTFRFGPRTKTVITVPSGRANEDLLMTKLPWADFSGDFNKQRPGVFSGAAIFVHPTHPDYPPTWMTRDYGMLAVGWPGVTPKTFAPGTPFTVRYRLWIHRGNPEAEQIQKTYDAYCATTKAR